MLFVVDVSEGFRENRKVVWVRVLVKERREKRRMEAQSTTVSILLVKAQVSGVLCK
jgi:hypothetical protein